MLVDKMDAHSDDLGTNQGEIVSNVTHVSEPLGPNAIVAVPGMGFLPNWFVQEFESLSKELKINHIFRNDTWRRNMANCDIVSQLFQSGIVPTVFNSENWCPPLFDNASCFPATPGGQLTVIPCMSEYSGVPYDTSGNASRSCSMSGEWEERTDYNNCQAIGFPVPPLVSTDYSSTIYLFGYLLSFAALTFAVVVYFAYRELWCLRNKLHLNLFLVNWFSIFSWICQALSQNFFIEHPPLICCTLIALRYFHLTTFFWMFVEGLYLWIKVSLPLQTCTIKLRHYICLGWGTPFFIMVIWTTLTFLTMATSNPNIQREVRSGFKDNSAWKWMGDDPYMLTCPIVDTKWELEWGYNIVLLILLLSNCFFLISIMVIVVAKIRSDPTYSEGNMHNYKGTKALLVLSALLGICYIITLAPPTTDIHGYRVFQYLRAILLSLQGFIITIPYCFINWRVKTLIQESMKRVREERQFRKETIARSSRNSISLGMFHSTNNAANSRFLSGHSSATATTTLNTQTSSIRGSNPEMQPLHPTSSSPMPTVRTLPPTVAASFSPSPPTATTTVRNGTSPRDVYATIHETATLVDDGRSNGNSGHKDVNL